jgi:Fur family ferric uptake transcriptional regulator
VSAERAERALRRHGLRVSTARRLVIQALYTAEGPVSAEEIAAGLDGRLPRSDLASVYRNLDTLQKIGLVRHVHLGHGPGRYAPDGGPPPDYLVCESCDAVVSVPAGKLDAAREAVRVVTGFEATFSHFPLSGTCASCANAASSARSGVGASDSDGASGWAASQPPTMRISSTASGAR